MNRPYFIGWVMFLVTMLGVMYYGFEVYFFSKLWDADASKLTWVIMAATGLGYLHLGKTIFIAELDDSVITEDELDVPYEIADTAMSLGMLGTVIGFIVMASSFTTVDFSDVSNIKQLFGLATSGMSTALYTTLFGLLSNIILRTGCFILSKRG